MPIDAIQRENWSSLDFSSPPTASGNSLENKMVLQTIQGDTTRNMQHTPLVPYISESHGLAKAYSLVHHCTCIGDTSSGNTFRQTVDCQSVQQR